ncbi:MAG: hypothetical protein EOP47_18345 [Sphingobacteriaceae bacterium]|nr:MAG: hypothetical protein EOP47_18345 [Sphingobacteriaceae bacterium]
MLKRTGIIALIMLYTVTVFGFALNFHYCGNKVASVKIDSPAKNCSPNTAKKMKCCKDKQVDIKVKDVHQAKQSQSFLSKIFSFDIPALPFEEFVLSAQRALIEKLFERGPPQEHQQSISVFLKNCTLRI